MIYRNSEENVTSSTSTHYSNDQLVDTPDNNSSPVGDNDDNIHVRSSCAAEPGAACHHRSSSAAGRGVDVRRPMPQTTHRHPTTTTAGRPSSGRSGSDSSRVTRDSCSSRRPVPVALLSNGRDNYGYECSLYSTDV